MIKGRFAYVISAIITILLLLMAITDNTFFLYISVALSVLCIANPYVVFCSYFIASLSGAFFSVGTIGAARLLSIITIISLLLKINNRNVFSNNYIWCMILVVYSFLSCATSVTGYITPFYNIIQCILVACLLINTRVDPYKIINFIVLNSIIVLSALTIEVTLDPSILWEERLSIGEVNSNDIAIMCEQLGSISIGSFMVFKKKSMRGVMVLASVISTIILLLSGSRAALLGLLAAIVFVIFAGSKEGIKNNIFAILVIFIIGILFIHMLSDIDSPILDRYDANDVIDTEGSGRLPYMKAIITQIIPYYPLFGVGMGGQNIMAMGIQKQCHNIVVDPISQIGFIGYILFLAFIIPHIARSYKSLKISSVAIIPLTMTFAAIVNGIGEVVFYEKFFWNDIALCGLIGYGVFHNRIDIE